MISEKEIFESLKAVKAAYGVDIARTVERIYRLETSHFKSEGFAKTFSAGMEKHGELYPYGWRSMEQLWSNEKLRPVDFWVCVENKGLINNGGKRKTFLVFPSLQAAMFSLAEFVKLHGAGRWYSTVLQMQSKYVNKLLSITPKIINSIT